MIVKENLIREDGVVLTRTYSDNNKYIQKIGTNEIYSEAVDIKPYEYEETEQEIENIKDYTT